jgi:protein subunit release factor B
MSAIVSPEKETALKLKMASLNISENDLSERFIRSGGKGGQNVNKVETGVYIKHLPTGIEVKCTEERSQYLNRFLARRLLCEKIENIRQGKQSQEEQEREKIRRQKRKRSKRAKDKMLASKRLNSEKKQLRSGNFTP